MITFKKIGERKPILEIYIYSLLIFIKMTIKQAQQTPVFYNENRQIFKTDLYSFISSFVNPRVEQKGVIKKKYFIRYDSNLMMYCLCSRNKKGASTSFYFESKKKAEEHLFSYLYNLLSHFYSEGKDYYFNYEIAEIENSTIIL